MDAMENDAAFRCLSSVRLPVDFPPMIGEIGKLCEQKGSANVSYFKTVLCGKSSAGQRLKSMDLMSNGGSINTLCAELGCNVFDVALLRGSFENALILLRLTDVDVNRPIGGGSRGNEKRSGDVGCRGNEERSGGGECRGNEKRSGDGGNSSKETQNLLSEVVKSIGGKEGMDEKGSANQGQGGGRSDVATVTETNVNVATAASVRKSGEESNKCCEHCSRHNERDWLPLHMTAYFGRAPRVAEFCRELCRRGASVLSGGGAKDGYGWLIWACAFGPPDLVQCLLETAVRELEKDASVANNVSPKLLLHMILASCAEHADTLRAVLAFCESVSSRRGVQPPSAGITAAAHSCIGQKRFGNFLLLCEAFGSRVFVGVLGSLLFGKFIADNELGLLRWLVDRDCTPFTESKPTPDQWQAQDAHLTQMMYSHRPRSNMLELVLRQYGSQLAEAYARDQLALRPKKHPVQKALSQRGGLGAVQLLMAHGFLLTSVQKATVSIDEEDRDGDDLSMRLHLWPTGSIGLLLYLRELRRRIGSALCVGLVGHTICFPGGRCVDELAPIVKFFLGVGGSASPTCDREIPPLLCAFYRLHLFSAAETDAPVLREVLQLLLDNGAAAAASATTTPSPFYSPALSVAAACLGDASLLCTILSATSANLLYVARDLLAICRTASLSSLQTKRLWRIIVGASVTVISHFLSSSASPDWIALRGQIDQCTKLTPDEQWFVGSSGEDPVWSELNAQQAAPHSLQHQCRAVLNAHLTPAGRRTRQELLCALSVPAVIRGYLNFDDRETTALAAAVDVQVVEWRRKLSPSDSSSVATVEYDRYSHSDRVERCEIPEDAEDELARRRTMPRDTLDVLIVESDDEEPEESGSVDTSGSADDHCHGVLEMSQEKAEAKNDEKERFDTEGGKMIGNLAGEEPSKRAGNRNEEDNEDKCSDSKDAKKRGRQLGEKLQQGANEKSNWPEANDAKRSGNQVGEKPQKKTESRNDGKKAIL